MNYEEVINTIENKRRFGKACGRDVTVEFMEALGHPESQMKIIHIAGTNGKGSTAAFVSSILQAASFVSEKPFKVGTFISPHLIDFTERIMVDGRQIPKEDARRIGEELLSKKISLEPTMFDYCLAMAMVYFKEQQVKYIVLETGLGGAKDSTSGLSTVPIVSAITSIGLEHTAILGNTYAEIASEKAGIIKKGTRVVIGQMPDEARLVIENKCKEMGTDFFEPAPLSDSIQLGLFGQYQKKNGAVAMEIAKQLDINISEEIILKGLKDARWPGRMQILSKEPFVMADGAHNPEGVQALHDSLSTAFKGERFTFIMAVMADKDYPSMALKMKDIAERFFTCTVDYSRALQSEKLAENLVDEGFEAYSCKSYKEALDRAKTFNEKIICFGSLYFIGEVLKNS